MIPFDMLRERRQMVNSNNTCDAGAALPDGLLQQDGSDGTLAITGTHCHRSVCVPTVALQKVVRIAGQAAQSDRAWMEWGGIVCISRPVDPSRSWRNLVGESARLSRVVCLAINFHGILPRPAFHKR